MIAILALSGRAHVTVAFVTVVAVVFILSLVRRQQVEAKYSLLWFFIGGLLVLFALWPGLLEWLSDRVGIAYPATTFLLLAVTFLFLLVVHFSYEVSRIDSRIRTLAEEIALLRAMLLDRTEISDPAGRRGPEREPTTSRENDGS